MKAFAAAGIFLFVQIIFIFAILLPLDVGRTSGTSETTNAQKLQSSLRKKPPSCLFIISTSQENRPDIISQFSTYDDDKSVGLWVNVYNNRSSIHPHSISTTVSSGGKRIITSSIPGIKPSLWQQTASGNYTKEYDYLYFLDEDMLFDKSVFAFDQFRWLVQRTDAVIASPRIIRMSASVEEPEKSTSEIITTGTIKKHAGGNRPKRRRLGGVLDPVGIYKEENTADRLVAKTVVLELGSFFIRTDAWHYFLENVFIPSEETDCGADCVWCRVFGHSSLAGRFGTVPCLRTLHVGIIHLDQKTYEKATANDQRNELRCMATVKAYFDKAKRLYDGIEGQHIGHCWDKSMEYMSLNDVGLESSAL
mmetsp:Transcript_35905/g.78632  ORF Transcript_35905/g.78632 Transcript_35905/m.78632 type:complete len:364 (+) Transcript_35905:181-1272(+)